MAKAKKQESKAEPASAPAAAGAAKAKAQPAAAADAPKAGAPNGAATTAAAGKPKKAAGGSKKATKGEAKSPGTPPQAPLIDTGLAAQTAAAMVAGRLAGAASGAAPQRQQAPQESSSFKNLKESLNKPAAGGLGGILGTGGGQKKFNPAFGGPKHGGGPAGGRNQTFGADVNRAGVPRRTGGG